MMRRVRRLALLVALLAVLTVLTPLAYATPPDPTWVSGFFDDDDNDNGLCLITSSLAALDPFPLCGSTPFPGFGAAVALENPGPAETSAIPTTAARPPQSLPGTR
jgi:hypothetical protein